MSADVNPEIVRRVEVSLVDRILTLGGRKGREWSFICPSHNERHPSANYNPEKKTWICRSCGAGGGVIDLAQKLGVELPEMEKSNERKVSAIYDYHDATGNLAYQVVRYEPKSFMQRRFVNGEYVYNLDGVPRVLFNLPAILSADQTEPVFVVEGEKDAKTMISYGFLATCNSGGADVKEQPPKSGSYLPAYSKVTPEIVKPLVGRRVILIPDNDAQGQAHMLSWSDALAKAGARPGDIETISLRDAGYKGDVSDWFAQGHTSDELRALIPVRDTEWTHIYDVLVGDRPVRPVLPTGFRDLDRLLRNGGLSGGQLFILAARPGVGKSAWAAGVAHSVAGSGRTVGLFSLEMSEEEVTERIARYGRLGRETRIFIDDRAGLKIAELVESATKLKEEEQANLFIVDYLQLVVGKYGGGNRVQDVGDISRTLKRLARDLDVPIIALCQLNREVEKRDSEGGRKYRLSDLRESGDLEQDADVVAFLDREEIYDTTSLRRGLATIQVEKQRNGPTGIVPLGFARSWTAFYNLTEYTPTVQVADHGAADDDTGTEEGV